MTAPPAAIEAHQGEGEDAIHPAPTRFLRRYVFSTDHKVIGRQFLFLGLVFLAVGGVMAMLIRWQLAGRGCRCRSSAGSSTAARGA